MKEQKRDAIMDAYSAWREDGGEENTSSLMRTLKPQMETALRTFAPGMEGQMRLKAMSMTMGAVRKYDPSKGMHLKSFVYQQLQPLQREYGKRHQPLYVPERHIMERKSLSQYENEFRSQQGRDPSTAELADFSGMSIRRIAAVRKAGVPVTESSRVSPETDQVMVSEREDPMEIMGHYVYSELDPTDQKIFEMVTGHGGVRKQPNNEIAKRLGISAPAVSQRISRIVARMQEGLNLEQ